MDRMTFESLAPGRTVFLYGRMDRWGGQEETFIVPAYRLITDVAGKIQAGDRSPLVVVELWGKGSRSRYSSHQFIPAFHLTRNEAIDAYIASERRGLEEHREKLLELEEAVPKRIAMAEAAKKEKAA